MAQVTGIVTIKIDGKLLLSNAGASLAFGGKTRTAVVGHRAYGYTEAVTMAEVECTISHRADTDLPQLNDITGATLLFETDTGKSYMVANAFTLEPVRLTGGSGEVSLRMSGDPAEEI